MTPETYQELFHYTIFPIFAISHQGELIYKNPSCGKYLPKVNKKTRMKSIFFPEIPTGTATVNLIDCGCYRTALALEDDGNLVVLCFSRFQYDDGPVIAEQSLRHFGRDLTSFLASLRYGLLFDKPSKAFPRTLNLIYTDILCSLRSEFQISSKSYYSLQRTIVPIFEKLPDSFSGLGYRISASIDEDFPDYLQICFSLNDLLFLFGRLLYLQLKISATKKLEIRLLCDIARGCHKLVLATDTKLSEHFDKNEDPAVLLSRLAPECAAEFAFLQKSGFLSRENIYINADIFGKLVLTYKIPYISPDTFYIRSNDFSDFLLPASVEYMLHSICVKLRDNGASC